MSEKAIRKTIDVYNKYAKAYSKHRYYEVPALKKDLDFFIRNIKGDRILDVGCGAGYDAVYLASQGYEVVGIDLASRLIEEASKKTTTATFRLMDMRDPDFQPGSFDGIWMSASFLHIPKKETHKMLHKLNSLLSDGGLLYVNVEKGEGEKLLPKEEYGMESRLLVFYSANELENLILNNGFVTQKRIVDEDPYGWIRIFASKK